MQTLITYGPDALRLIVALWLGACVFYAVKACVSRMKRVPIDGCEFWQIVAGKERAS